MSDWVYLREYEKFAIFDPANGFSVAKCIARPVSEFPSLGQVNTRDLGR